MKKKTLAQRLIDWLFDSRDRVEDAWNKRGSHAVRVTIEFDCGESRELVGSAADEWVHDIHRRNYGRRVDWSRHKWIPTKKP